MVWPSEIDLEKKTMPQFLLHWAQRLEVVPEPAPNLESLARFDPDLLSLLNGLNGPGMAWSKYILV